EALGLDLHQRRRELGKDIQGHARNLQPAENQQQQRSGQHEIGQLDAGADQGAQERSSLTRPSQGATSVSEIGVGGAPTSEPHCSPTAYSEPSSSGAPTVTTSAPTGGPPVRYTVLPTI